MTFPSDEVIAKGFLIAGIAYVIIVVMYACCPLGIIFGRKLFKKTGDDVKKWYKPVGIALMVLGVLSGLCALLIGPVPIMLWLSNLFG